MKIRIKVRNIVTAEEWAEDYDRVGIGDNGNIGQAEDWAAQLIKWFNETCRPGESHRELLSTELVGASTEHNWYKRTDGMSVPFRGHIVDIFECRDCGITGKRIGIAGGVRRDSAYKAKKYAICSHVRV